MAQHDGDLREATAGRRGLERSDDEEVAPAGASGIVGRQGPFEGKGRPTLILLGVLVVHVILARLTLRDLHRRPQEAIRGPSKRLWQLWAVTNTTGSIAYWVFGRRRPGGVT